MPNRYLATLTVVAATTAAALSGCSDDSPCNPVGCGPELHITFEPPAGEPGSYAAILTSDLGEITCSVALTDSSSEGRSITTCSGDFNGEITIVEGAITSASFYAQPTTVSLELRRDGELVQATGSVAPVYSGDGGGECGEERRCINASLAATSL
jgi:hypothetical protein